MHRIMLNWFMLVVGLVFSASAFNNPLRQEHHGHHRHRFGVEQVQLQDIVYETPSDQITHFEPATECNVTGKWYNSLGSEIILTVDRETGHVTGEFRTAVERRPGAAGSGPGRVSGWTSMDGSHNAIAFSVLWSNGASATAWTGLCHVCQGQEIMKTTWILTSEVDTCEDHWSSNRIGQDDFTRMEMAPGPRQHLGLNTPSDFTEAAERFREGVLSQNRQGV
ncbi:fibropellin-3-like [Lytechinus pictus]|uniref:fibropellin-3-like n=1 Tax=Lytechinus pictus TaxID=7653 RepID=UPI0030B9CA38